MKSQRFDIIYLVGKVRKKFHRYPNKRKQLNGLNLNILKRNTKFSKQKKHQTAVHVIISRRNGRNESQATKFNSYQSAIS